MKLGLERVLVIGSVLLMGLGAQACAKAQSNGIPGGNVSGDGGVDGSKENETESEDDPPHALGVITLTEMHTAGSSSVTPSVSAAFLPEATALEAKCGREIDGCTLAAKPDCGDADAGLSTCGSDEVCTLNEECESVCQPIPSCFPSCDTEEEVCKLVGTKSKCVPKVEFNAGVITLSGDGVTKSVTLRPPYSFSATGDSPFVPEAEISVNATGATETGFEKFKDTFMTTSFIQTTPALEKLDPAKVFEGTGPVAIGWKPGEDDIRISVSGNKGSAICTGDDASGKFDITRKVMRAVHEDDGSSFSTPTVSISITRSKTKLKKDGKTMGEIEGVDLPPVGFVRFTTQSIESFSVQGCPSGQKRCPSTSGTGTVCTNILSDRYNCGDCEVMCTSVQSCFSGTCG